MKNVVKFLVAIALVAIFVSGVSSKKPGDVQPVPSNLEEAIAALDTMLAEEDKIEFAALKEKKAGASAHFSAGMWMRNNWGLWGGSALKTYFNELGIFHPDDMSSIILTSFHRSLTGRDIKLDEQVEYYKCYWSIKDDRHSGLKRSALLAYSVCEIGDTVKCVMKVRLNKGIKYVVNRTSRKYDPQLDLNIEGVVIDKFIGADPMDVVFTLEVKSLSDGAVEMHGRRLAVGDILTLSLVKWIEVDYRDFL